MFHVPVAKKSDHTLRKTVPPQLRCEILLGEEFQGVRVAKTVQQPPFSHTHAELQP